MSEPHTAPDLGPEPGWTALPLPYDGESPRSFVSGDPSPDRIRIRYYRRKEDGALVGKCWFGPGTQGPPGNAHGGSIAAVLDEAMGAAVWISGHMAVAATLTTQFRRLLPVGSVVRVECWVESVEGRKVRARGRLMDEAGQTFSEGECLLIELEPERWGEWATHAFGTMMKKLEEQRAG